MNTSTKDELNKITTNFIEKLESENKEHEFKIKNNFSDAEVIIHDIEYRKNKINYNQQYIKFLKERMF